MQIYVWWKIEWVGKYVQYTIISYFHLSRVFVSLLLATDT